jgi:hypothetical protein
VLLPSHRTFAPPLCLPLGIKDPLKEDARLFAFGILDMGVFWKGGLLEGDC